MLVETSGLADPAPILHALMMDAGLAGRFVIGGVVVLVDAVLGVATLAAHPEARRQVAFADRVVVTKTDVVAIGPALRAAIAGQNDTAPVECGPVECGPPSPALLFAAATRDVPENVVAQHTPGVVTCLIRRVEPVPALALTLLLEALAEQCGEKLLRLKGLVNLAEAPGRAAVIHAVQHIIAPVELLGRWPGADETTRIVVIGVGIPPYFPARLLDAIIADMAGAQAGA